ncbi:MAG: hypothetical protein CMF39_04275 [Legionellaceae bacterium]|nr:hypothetical protein [Legionellaceae bacterium]
MRFFHAVRHRSNGFSKQYRLLLTAIPEAVFSVSSASPQPTQLVGKPQPILTAANAQASLVQARAEHGRDSELFAGPLQALMFARLGEREFSKAEACCIELIDRTSSVAAESGVWWNPFDNALGVIHCLAGNLGESHSVFEQILSRVPNKPLSENSDRLGMIVAHNNMSAVLAELGQGDEAQAVFRTAEMFIDAQVHSGLTECRAANAELIFREDEELAQSLNSPSSFGG